MGTDVFLRWDGMAKEETDSQITASRVFKQDAGRRGYIRAAAGMKREVVLFRLLFPLEYWYNASGEPMPYNFQLGQAALNRGARAYLQSVREGTVPDFRDYPLPADSDTARAAEAQSGTGIEDLELQGAKEWLEEVAEFFALGTKKQATGLSPSILIVWWREPELPAR